MQAAGTSLMIAKSWPNVVARNPVSSDRFNLVQNLNGSLAFVNSVIAIITPLSFLIKLLPHPGFSDNTGRGIPSVRLQI